MNDTRVEIEVFNNTDRPRTVSLELLPYGEDGPPKDERVVRVPGMPRGLRNGGGTGKTNGNELPNHRAVRLDGRGADALTCTVSVELDGGSDSRFASVPIVSDLDATEATTVASVDPGSSSDVGAEDEYGVADGSAVDVDDGSDDPGESDEGPPRRNDRAAGEKKPKSGRGRRPNTPDDKSSCDRAENGDGIEPKKDDVILEVHRFVACDEES